MRIVAVTCLALSAAATATAQNGAPPPDRAGMERALQQADGPKRRILEAARAKVLAPAPAPAVAVVGAPPLATAPSTAAAPPRVDAPDSEIVVVVTMGGAIEPVALPASASVRGVAGVALPGAVSTAPPALIDLPPALPSVADLPPPRLLAMIEPELSPRLFRRGSTRAEVLVELVIDTDGSVKSAVVRQSVNSDLEGAVLDAVRQWRYDPQPVARPHLLRLVVSPP
jgi:TonB family protein